MQANVKFKRKYFISHAFQLNFILRFVGLVMIGSILSGLLLYFYMARQLNNGPEVMYHNTMGLLVPAIFLTQLIVGIFIISITTYVVLLLSHRIAGPLYHLERVAEQVGNGDLTIKVRFRNKDALMSFKRSFQNMIDNLQCRMLRLRDNVQELRIIENDIMESLIHTPMPQSEKEQLNRAIKEFIDRYEDSLKEFKLPEPKPSEEYQLHG